MVLLLGAAALGGCNSTAQVAQAPSFTETASNAGADAGFQLALPDTVSVLPQPSGTLPAVASAEAGVQVASAEQALAPAGQEIATDAAFAGSTPQAPAAPAALKAAMPDMKAFPPAPSVLAVETVAYAVPDNPAGTVRGEVDKLITKYAAIYELPEAFVRRVVKRESTFNPRAYNRGHWGLMQIKHATARGMGYQGPAKGLLDAETNLKYAVKYLRGAWLVSGGNADRADRLYQTGYYYDAKRKGLLEETGLGRDRVRHRLKEEPMPQAVPPQKTDGAPIPAFQNSGA